MKVFGVTQPQLREVLDSLDLWADDLRHFPKGGYGFSVRPKGDRFRVDPMSPDDDYFVTCQHGHEALILALLKQGATVYTVLAKYGPHLLEGDRWERKQAQVVEKHRQRYPTHQACHCEALICPQCSTALKYDGGKLTCPDGHGSFATEIRELPVSGKAWVGPVDGEVMKRDRVGVEAGHYFLDADRGEA